MDNDSLSALEKLKQLKSVKKPEPGLDPNIFFTQLPTKKAETINSINNDDELFGSNTTSQKVENSGDLTEDDLFGGQAVNIIPSSNFEAIETKKEDKISEIEKALANTKIEEPITPKVETVEDSKEQVTVNGVKKYVIKEEDKPSAKVTKATKAIQKASHNSKELDDVDLLEKVLISLMLNNIKK